MDILEQWALFWGVPAEALADLRKRMMYLAPPPQRNPGESEAAIQTRVRLEASRKGIHLWRNNVGVAMDAGGVPVRYGIANDSSQVNKVLKSSDLIGVRPVLVTADMIGRTLGVFVAREVKRDGWVFRGTPREQAQQRFLQLIAAAGGDAAFTTGEGSL